MTSRKCYGVDMSEASARYEVKKHCTCDRCSSDLRDKRLPVSSITVYTRYVYNVGEIEAWLEKWNCAMWGAVYYDWDKQELMKFVSSEQMWRLSR